MSLENIANRDNVFYWQTDRAVSPEEAGRIWADRHRYFSDAEIIERVSDVVGESIRELRPLDPDAQTNLGNVNSVRMARLESGREVIIRSHPKGIPNGYFHTEALAAGMVRERGLPSYETLAVHDYEGGEDFAFHVCERLEGTAVQRWLEDNPSDEATLLPKIGAMMARIHQIPVEGFGPFDNTTARSESCLRGVHPTLSSALEAGLAFNLEALIDANILTSEQADRLRGIIDEKAGEVDSVSPVLIHNDFADWNLLTDGNDVTGILDWDECVGGDPAEDIACWSTFFPPERVDAFLNGYWSEVGKPNDFQARFELYRLRYVISKMTLRVRRYSWEPTEAIKNKIEAGRTHLSESLAFFGVT